VLIFRRTNCISTASGIVTVFGWLFSTQVTRGLESSRRLTCRVNIHQKRVTILDAVLISGVPRGCCGVQTPPKFRRPSIIVPNSARLWKLLKIAEFRTPTHEDVRKKCSKILKLLSVRNCFTLAMTNKLVVIINSLKLPIIKKILLYEMKFLVPNYSCLQNPWLEGYRPQIPVPSVLCP